MAKTNSSACMLLNLTLILAIILLSSSSAAEGKLFGFSRFLQSATVTCNSVYSVQPNDTCFAVQQKFQLTAEQFGTINPNLVCEKLFVGQWLCIDGTAA